MTDKTLAELLERMTTDELMDMPVTEELNWEVDKRVWKAQGGTPKTWCHGDIHLIDDRHTINCCQKCGYRGPWGKDSMGYIMFDHYEIPPDITRPENFWPLAWDNNILIVRERGLAGYWDNATLHNFIKALNAGRFDFHVAIVQDDQPGRAVAFAYLKVKEQDN